MGRAGISTSLLLLGILVFFECGRPQMFAQELSVSAGAAGSGDASSYSWQLDYRYQFDRHLAWSLSWLNEGHELGHRRDGPASQFWTTLPFFSDQFSVAFGAGAYHYSDTQELPRANSANIHGWTPLYSLSATYYTDSPWFVRLTANRINKASDLATNTLALGVGYQLAEKRRRSFYPITGQNNSSNEVTLFLGQSVVNTLYSESAEASAIEFRHALGKYFDWTLTWLNEGNPSIIRRNGLATQAWFGDVYLDRKLYVGLGVGMYLYFDRKAAPVGQDSGRDFAPLVSPGIAYEFGDHWTGRLVWHRVISDYNRDSDIFLVGLGYRWGGRSKHAIGGLRFSDD